MRPLILTLLAVALLPAADAPKLPPTAEKAYKAYVAQLTKAYQAETDKLRLQLKKEMETATKKGDLDSAMAVKGLMADLDKGQGLDDAKAAAQSGPLGESADAADGVKGWASVAITPADPRVQVADARIGTVAILNTTYTFANMSLPVPKGVDCKVMQVPQAYSGPTTVKVTAPGRIYFVSGLPVEALLAQLPRELKASPAGGVSAPGIVSVVSATAAAGSTFTLQGHEVRVIAGAITLPSATAPSRK